MIEFESALDEFKKSFDAMSQEEKLRYLDKYGFVYAPASTGDEENQIVTIVIHEKPNPKKHFKYSYMRRKKRDVKIARKMKQKPPQ